MVGPNPIKVDFENMPPGGMAFSFSGSDHQYVGGPMVGYTPLKGSME